MPFSFACCVRLLEVRVECFFGLCAFCYFVVFCVLFVCKSYFYPSFFGATSASLQIVFFNPLSALHMFFAPLLLHRRPLATLLLSHTSAHDYCCMYTPLFVVMLQMEHFMQNFNDDEGFFATTCKKWKKWTDRHQHLPLSMARLGCSYFFVGKWAGSELSYERAVGQEFARAFLGVLWPEQYTTTPRTDRESDYRDILRKDVKEAKTAQQKDELTFGLYSVLDGDRYLRDELALYASSAKGGHVRGGEKDKGVSKFPAISEFESVYREVRHRFYSVPIHQQLVESSFSKYDTCTRATDFSELDAVRTCQYRSSESRHILKSDAQPAEIRGAGKRRKEVASASRKKMFAQLPLERSHRKRGHDYNTYLSKFEEQNSKKRRVAAVSGASSDSSDGSSSESEIDDDTSEQVYR